MTEQKGGKSAFVSKFVEIILTIIFIWKSLLDCMSISILCYSVFFADPLKYRTLNKTSCRALAVNYHQVITH